MSPDFLIVLAIAGVAAIASPIGGLIALWRGPTSLFMSMALGFASGVMLATISFEMVPKASDLSSLMITVGGFVAGFLAVYGFDLFIHRGRVAGEKADQHADTERFHRRKRPRGGEVTVLAGGTSAEEVIEGVTIGVGTAIQPGVGILIAIAIAIDNIAEALSIGELIRAEQSREKTLPVKRVLGWTGLVGASLFVPALLGWWLLRGLPQPVLGFLFATGAGGMFYLTITDLIPEAEERHYQQSAAIAVGAGFMVIFVLSKFL